MNTENKEIKERFDKEFGDFYADNDGGGIVWKDRLGQGEALRAAIKTFLNQELTTARKEERKKILERLNDKRFTQMDIAMNADLTFLKYTPTEIYNKALQDVTDIINQLN